MFLGIVQRGKYYVAAHAINKSIFRIIILLI